MSVLVRRAGRRDLPAIHALWRHLRELQAKADPRLAPAKDADKGIRDHREVVLADPRTGMFVAEQQGEVLGYLHAQVDANEPSYDPPRFGTLVELCVREDWRGQGIGSRLLLFGQEWLHSLGINECRALLPVASEEARRFFEKHGFAPAWLGLRQV